VGKIAFYYKGDQRVGSGYKLRLCIYNTGYEVINSPRRVSLVPTEDFLERGPASRRAQVT
jgi:hypothetical protein